MADILTAGFFRGDAVECARNLIGCEFYWDGCVGRVVETEAYRAVGDPACHIFCRPSARAFFENHGAGTAYVYLNYGVHWLFNVLVKGREPGAAGFVLLRALEPIEGLGRMRQRRGREALGDLCSGPGKLAQALGIGGAAHARPFLACPRRGFRAGAAAGVVADERIGISRGRSLPWRFTEEGSRFLSRPAARA